MTTDPVLVLAQWLSPGFPVGAFAYAHGLEAALDDGLLPDAGALTEWVSDVVTQGAGRADAILLRAAYDGAPDADAYARAFCAGAERLQETDLQGAAFCQTLKTTEGMNLGALTYPVAVGQAAAQKGLPVDLTVAMYLQAFVANLIAAAQRLMPMGQTQAQQVLNQLRPVVVDTAAETDGMGLDDLQSLAWMSDIAAMRHETMTTRIFRT